MDIVDNSSAVVPSGSTDSSSSLKNNGVQSTFKRSAPNTTTAPNPNKVHITESILSAAAASPLYHETPVAETITDEPELNDDEG
ncbi:hypothetical protein DOLIC_00075 [Dolichomitus sp. PSUC_FEM 10030005]|nr:hypothetical protein [Dolichomitus sp. PSUC_FEM 10030005]